MPPTLKKDENLQHHSEDFPARPANPGCPNGLLTASTQLPAILPRVRAGHLVYRTDFLKRSLGSINRRKRENALHRAAIDSDREDTSQINRWLRLAKEMFDTDPKDDSISVSSNETSHLKNKAS